MKIYLVGGAVRDKLLGIKEKDHDWVVVGATEQQMLDLGFLKIDASFPVFKHPKTKDEYALARAEKKVRNGYKGFETIFTPNISLKDDLKRRDLTINSIAMDSNGVFIDPYNGQNDIQNRILRHTSDAFIEDPLRVVRLARLMAQLSNYNFTIATETKSLINTLVQSGELKYLTKERVSVEFTKSLNNPKAFIQTLEKLKCLEQVFPTINKYRKLITKIDFFETLDYRELNKHEKIAATLSNMDTDTLDKLRNELSLSNKSYKLCIASANIQNLLLTKKDAPRALQTIKKTNIMRDSELLLSTTNVIKCLTNKADNKTLITSLYNLCATITALNSIDIQKLIQNVDKSDIPKTVENIYISNIKKHLKL